MLSSILSTWPNGRSVLGGLQACLWLFSFFSHFFYGWMKLCLLKEQLYFINRRKWPELHPGCFFPLLSLFPLILTHLHTHTVNTYCRHLCKPLLPSAWHPPPYPKKHPGQGYHTHAHSHADTHTLTETSTLTLLSRSRILQGRCLNIWDLTRAEFLQMKRTLVTL